jgi:hypothetical protein
MSTHTQSCSTVLWKNGGKIGSAQANVKTLLGPRPNPFLIPLEHLVV